MKYGKLMAGATMTVAMWLALPQTFAAGTEPLTGQRGVVGGHGTPGYLGVDLRDVTEERVSVLKLKDVHGAEIIRVDHDGPAGKMGLRVHDVVMLMNGIAVESGEQIRRMLHELSPGRLISLVVNRDGQQMVMQAQMADREELEKETWEHHYGAQPEAPATGLPTGEVSAAAVPGAAATSTPAGGGYSRGFIGTLLMTPTYTGVMLEKIGPQLAGYFGLSGGNGLLVRSVADNSPGAMAGLRAGDVVMRANQSNVGSPADWSKAVRAAKGGPVTVVVMRDRQEKTFTLTPDTKKRSCIELRPTDPPPVMARLTES